MADLRIFVLKLQLQYQFLHSHVELFLIPQKILYSQISFFLFLFLESKVKSIEGGAKQLLGKQSDNNQVGAVSDWRQHENSPSNQHDSSP